MIQIDILWLCHVSVIFVKTQFPFYFRGIGEKIRAIHLTVILLAVLLPCIPVIAAFSTGGYSTALYPQAVCFIKNPDAAYYSFAFMFSVIIAIGGPLLIINFITTIKVLCTSTLLVLNCVSVFNFQLKFKRWKNSNAETLATTELKLLFLLCFLIINGSAIIAATTVTAQNSDKLIAGFENYFACEATGTNPKCDSIKEALEPLAAGKIWITADVCLGLFPAMHLLYVVNFGAIQQKLAYLWSSTCSFAGWYQ